MNDYYSKSYIGHLIREQLKDRELAFLGQGNVRALRMNSLYDLNRALTYVSWDKKKQKMYRSVAKLREIPNFTFNPKNRSSETYVWFNEEFDDLVYEYDCFFDFDKDEDSTIYDVLNEVKILLEEFNEYKIPYYVLFSGNKGFQVIIPGEYMGEVEIVEGVVERSKKLIENVKTIFKFKYLDLANVGIPNRLCKVPYSLVNDNVVLPLSDRQIETFHLDDVKINNVIKGVPLIRRGVLERFKEIPKEEKIKNIEDFEDSISFK